LGASLDTDSGERGSPGGPDRYESCNHLSRRKEIMSRKIMSKINRQQENIKEIKSFVSLDMLIQKKKLAL
jgi:hypothetical protein